MITTLLTALSAILLVLLGFALLLVAVFWGGKCPSCGSWRTSRQINISFDDHQPDKRFENVWCHCAACGHKEHLSVKTRKKAELASPWEKHPAYRKD